MEVVPYYRPKNVNKKNLSVALDRLFNNYQELEEIIFKYGTYAINTLEYQNRTYFTNHYDTNMLNKVTVNETCFKVFPIDYLNKIWDTYNQRLLTRARRGPKMMLVLYLLYEQFFTKEISEILIDRMRGYKNLFYIDYLIKHAVCFNDEQLARLKTLKLTFKLI